MKSVFQDSEGNNGTTGCPYQALVHAFKSTGLLNILWASQIA